MQMIKSGEIPDPHRLLRALAGLQVHVDAQARHYVDESFRQGIQIKAAQARIAELEREVRVLTAKNATLAHYRDVVEQALAEAE